MIVSTNDQYYKDIASALRTKIGGVQKYYPSQMAAAINGITAPSIVAYLASGIQQYNTTGGKTLTIDVTKDNDAIYYAVYAEVIKLGTPEQVAKGFSLYNHNFQRVSYDTIGLTILTTSQGSARKFLAQYTVPDANDYIVSASVYVIK